MIIGKFIKKDRISLYHHKNKFYESFYDDKIRFIIENESIKELKKYLLINYHYSFNSYKRYYRKDKRFYHYYFE